MTLINIKYIYQYKVRVIGLLQRQFIISKIFYNFIRLFFIQVYNESNHLFGVSGYTKFITLSYCEQYSNIVCNARGGSIPSLENSLQKNKQRNIVPVKVSHTACMAKAGSNLGFDRRGR